MRFDWANGVNSCPHPILIKLESCWDKWLLSASCRKLEGYSQHKLFIHEDLPPDARTNKHKESVHRTTSTSKQPDNGTTPNLKLNSSGDTNLKDAVEEHDSTS